MSSTKPVTRKRSRPQLQEKEELSPVPTNSPLSSIKRRRLNGHSSSPPTPDYSKIPKRQRSRLVGLNVAKENIEDDTGAVDELTDDIETAVSGAEEEEIKSGSNRKSSRNAARGKAIMAQYAKSPQVETSSKKLSLPGKRAMLNKAKALARQAVRSRMQAAGFEEEDLNEWSNNDTVDDESQQKQNSATEDEGDVSESGAGTNGTPRLNGRQKQQARRFSSEMVDPLSLTPKGILTPNKRRPGRPRKSVAFENGLTGREVDLGFKDLPKDSGVIRRDTPLSKSSQSKGKGSRASTAQSKKHALADQQSVYDFEVSDEEDASGAVKSKDFALSKSAPLSKSASLLEDDLDPEGSEGSDIVCKICSGAETEPPNEIILCDNCDLAVHQECYNVPLIPEGDWLCRDCQPEGYSHNLQVDVDTIPGVSFQEISSDLPNIEGFSEHLRLTQRLVLDRLTGNKPIKLRGHDDEMQKVHQVVEQTILAGEGNSMLVIGARGSGKTTLVESVISDLSIDHREKFHVIRLNGFIHTDDKLALREIWRQLGREMEVEEDVTGKTQNHADTLASLLALLSHPSEISETQADHTAKSVIFILDEFDLFTTHARQTLLYNLFDIAQARKAPIAVLGLTTRIDVVESLEKRVKSRFSHRYVHLSLPRSLPAFWDICKDGLLIDTDELGPEGLRFEVGQDEFLSCWRSMVEDLFYKDSLFRQQFQTYFYRSKSVPAFFTSCILPIANLSASNFPLTGKSFALQSTSLSAPDSKLHILHGLSELELALLIAAARLDIILDTDTCNFAMAYDEYSSLTSRHKIQTSSTGVAALGASAKVWDREVALGAWEQLVEYQLLVPASFGGGGGRDVGMAGRMWKVDIGLEEISGSVDDLSTVMTKWCREI